jgi:hypothetical protein
VAGANTSLWGSASDDYHGQIDSNGAPGTGSKTLNVTGASVPGIIAFELIEGGGGGGDVPAAILIRPVGFA